MKTKEELTALRKEYEALSVKLSELNDDELKLVTGGAADGSTGSVFDVPDSDTIFERHFYDNKVARPGDMRKD